jgi:hypothetical protein
MKRQIFHVNIKHYFNKKLEFIKNNLKFKIIFIHLYLQVKTATYIQKIQK